MADRSHPIEGQVVLLAGAKASVTLWQLSALLERVQRHLVDERDEYDRRFERVEAAADGADGQNGAGHGEPGADGDEDCRAYFLADADHWEAVGEDLDLDGSEVDAVRRAHEAQFRRDGRRLDREEEFETAVEIRDPVVIAPE